MILCLVISLTTGSFANQISNDISKNRQIEELFDLKSKVERVIRLFQQIMIILI